MEKVKTDLRQKVYWSNNYLYYQKSPMFLTAGSHVDNFRNVILWWSTSYVLFPECWNVSALFFFNLTRDITDVFFLQIVKNRLGIRLASKLMRCHHDAIHDHFSINPLVFLTRLLCSCSFHLTIGIHLTLTSVHAYRKTLCLSLQKPFSFFWDRVKIRSVDTRKYGT